MANFVKTPFKDPWVKSLGTSSDWEGNVKAGGDIEIKGQDVVIMGPEIADEPSDLAGVLSSLTSRAK